MLAKFELRDFKARVQGGPHAKILVGRKLRVFLGTEGLDQVRRASMSQPVDSRRTITDKHLRLHAGDARVLAIRAQ
ncbi:hypothetical protein D3C76_1364090 [compost metagenome]